MAKAKAVSDSSLLAKKRALRSNASSQSLFLTAFGAIYVAVFASFWLQYSGTLGKNGLLPVDAFWSEMEPRFKSVSAAAFDVPYLGTIDVGRDLAKATRRFLKLPCVLFFRDVVFAGTDVDTIIEGVSLVGVCCGILALLGVHHVSVFATAFLAYLTCYIVGQRWLGFQWDIFLLETGASILLYAPWWSIRSAFSHPAAAWLHRAQFVKFMLMSGVVKVTANCPTWRDLTALEYHFASTCLPTSEAWIHHSLPPFLLRMGVAVMFLLELVAPWLLLIPIRPVRQVGVIAQVPLQLAIMLTGNYNWFNLHTMALLLPSWDADVDLAGEPFAWISFILVPLRCWERAWRSRLGRFFGISATVAALVWLSVQLFPITLDRSAGPLGLELLMQPNGLRIENKADSRFVRRMLDMILQQRSFLALYACLIISGVAHALSPPPGRTLVRLIRCLWRLFVCGVVVIYLGVTLLPLSSIHREPSVPFKEYSVRLNKALTPFHVSSSYGLFRRMTGVGQASSGKQYQWGGLPPSVVEVPAVVVEGRSDLSSSKWHEIPFRYAPYKPERAPRRTAPHQPRLDWQMWFAALGSYQHNPWFVHLIWKLLMGFEEVIDLLDIDEYPFKDAPPTEIRASLYHYDFTRLASPWAERQPPGSLARMINATRGSKEHKLWWTRKRVGEYFPSVTASMIRQSVQEQGWLLQPERKSVLDLFRTCADARQQARSLKSQGSIAWLGAATISRACEGTVLLRYYGAEARKFVGYKFEIPLFAWFWSGASTACFADGPLLIIGALTLSPLCIKLFTIWTWRVLSYLLSCCCPSRGTTRAGGKKLKNE
eukprot:TRINITY_DN28258_c0_g1_i1.p1 TRINITY_DN28258_c0_g1~~TRINITY_DN28258_c0_g1_i1.p1  ORF type:complete len:841 (-),score=71.30 TRINITY_DN28258_c0_g1_i1:117-2591(-)